jgi:hypothetical protein
LHPDTTTCNRLVPSASPTSAFRAAIGRKSGNFAHHLLPIQILLNGSCNQSNQKTGLDDCYQSTL